MLQHIVIRRSEFTVGSREKPNIQIVMQTNTKRIPLQLSKLKQNQVIWGKWTGGPIYGKAKILSWHSGQIVNGNVNEARELTIGSLLFGLDSYWEHLVKKKNLFYVVVRLVDEEYLEKLIYPTVKSYGNSWIYLDTPKKIEDWLTNYTPPKPTLKNRRKIPAGLRFDVFKRDNFTCVYCGRSPPEIILHADHVIPWSKVKKHEKENLVTSCRDCNLGKSDKII